MSPNFPGVYTRPDGTLSEDPEEFLGVMKSLLAEGVELTANQYREVERLTKMDGKVVNIEDAMRHKGEEAMRATQAKAAQYENGQAGQKVKGYGGAIGAAQTQGASNPTPDSCKDTETAPGILSDRMHGLHSQLHYNIQASAFHQAQAVAIGKAIELMTAHPELEALVDLMRTGII